MAIRLRNIDGCVVALCAAKTEATEGDMYLDDSAHHALSTKFAIDWESEGLLVDPPADEIVKQKMINAEIHGVFS